MAAQKKVQPKVVEEVKTEVTLESSGITADDIVKSILNNRPSNDSVIDYIPCHSVIEGGLNVVCPSGSKYKFKEYGAEADIEKRDLITLIKARSEHVFNPRFVIDDDNFLSEFPQVQKAYENLYTDKELDELFTLPVDSMVREIKNLPPNIYDGLKNRIATKIANGSIDSVRKIRALSEVYDSDFNLLSELFAR